PRISTMVWRAPERNFRMDARKVAMPRDSKDWSKLLESALIDARTKPADGSASNTLNPIADASNDMVELPNQAAGDQNTQKELSKAEEANLPFRIRRNID